MQLASVDDGLVQYRAAPGQACDTEHRSQALKFKWLIIDNIDKLKLR